MREKAGAWRSRGFAGLLLNIISRFTMLKPEKNISV